MHPTVPLRISQTSSNTAHCASTFIITIHIHATYNKQNSMLHCESYPAQWVTQSAVYSAVEQQLTPSWCLPQVGFLCLLCNLTNQWISYNLPTDLIDSQMLSVAIYITSFYMFLLAAQVYTADPVTHYAGYLNPGKYQFCGVGIDFLMASWWQLW